MIRDIKHNLGFNNAIIVQIPFFYVIMPKFFPNPKRSNANVRNTKQTTLLPNVYVCMFIPANYYTTQQNYTVESMKIDVDPPRARCLRHPLSIKYNPEGCLRVHNSGL